MNPTTNNQQPTTRRLIFHNPIKKAFFSAFLLMFSAFLHSGLFSQTTAFTYIPPITTMDPDQVKVFNYVNNLPHVGNVQFIQWDQSNMVNSGNISCIIPGLNNGLPVNFELVNSHHNSPIEYSLEGKSTEGEISIFVRPEGKGGLIYFNESVFEIFPINSNVSIIIKYGNVFNQSLEMCGNENTSGDDDDIIFCIDDCGSAIIDLLVVVTPNASQYLNANFGSNALFYLKEQINNLNIALSNSNIDKKKFRAKVIFPLSMGFNLTNIIESDLKVFGASPFYNEVKSQHGADIVLLLTNQNYQNPGKSNSVLAKTNSKFCIVEAPFIGTIRHAMAHEIGHLLGCRHNNDTYQPPQCFHAKILDEVEKNTIVSDGNDQFKLDYSRLLHYSNPDKLYAGYPTGSHSTVADPYERNNAAQIRGSFCTAACLNQPTWFSLDFHQSVACPDFPFIAGVAHNQGFQEFGGIYEFCTDPFSYEWSWSLSPGFQQYTVIGTDPLLTLSEPPHCPHFWLRVKVSSTQGCEEILTKFVKCNVCDHRTLTNDEFSENIYSIFPNPASDETFLNFTSDEDIKSIIGIDLNGENKINLQFQKVNEYSYDINLTNLHTGMWIIKLQLENNYKILKLIKK